MFVLLCLVRRYFMLVFVKRCISTIDLLHLATLCAFNCIICIIIITGTGIAPTAVIGIYFKSILVLV